MAHHHHSFFHRVRKEIAHIHSPKRVIRGTAKQLVYVNRIGGAVVSAAGGYFGGPVVGEALAAGFATNGGYLRSVQARNEGHAKDARRLGRSERKRDFINNSIAVGGGALASGVTTAVAGGSIGQTLAATGGGQVGGNLIAGGASGPGLPGFVGGQAAPVASPSALTGFVGPADLAVGGGSPGGAGGGAFVTSYSQLGITPATGGGFLGGTGSVLAAGGGILASIAPTVIKSLLGGGAGGGHVLGDGASSGPGAVGGSGGGDSGGVAQEGMLAGIDFKSPVTWAVIGVGAFVLYKAGVLKNVG